MYRRKLGCSGIEISAFALGSMTFGEQNDAASACALLSRAEAAGINFYDTAEMYPAPARARTYGESERIIGTWLRRRGRRDDLVIATKVAGPGAFVPWIRHGRSSHTAANLDAAVDGSLHRLGTDYIDLLQLHWPDRAANYFGRLGFKPARAEAGFSIESTLRALARLVASGKVRAIGVCNETAWGITEFLRLARQHALPEIAAIQNPYNLLNRSVEVAITEIAWREGCSLIAYSPLAFGVLTGKYLDGTASAAARLSRFRHDRRYSSAAGQRAARRYIDLAREAGIDPAHLALAWLASKPALTSVIIGATSEAQLAHNLAALDIEIPRALDKAIDAVHQEISNPCP